MKKMLLIVALMSGASLFGAAGQQDRYAYLPANPYQHPYFQRELAIWSGRIPAPHEARDALPFDIIAEFYKRGALSSADKALYEELAAEKQLAAINHSNPYADPYVREELAIWAGRKPAPREARDAMPEQMLDALYRANLLSPEDKALYERRNRGL